jgi:hypothetical protein
MRNPNMVRCRLAKRIGDCTIYVIYIGPRDSIPAGWSIQMRRVVQPGGMAA